MPRPDRVRRFSRAVRYTHRATSGLFVTLSVTGLVLYLPALSLLVGRRPLVEALHVAAGLVLPMPALAAWLSPEFRADMSALNRFTAADWAWLRRSDRRAARLPLGKFNGGQKLAAACFAAAVAVLFGTGIMLLIPTQLHLSTDLRQGATIVHDTTTWASLLLLVAHAWIAYSRPEARRALRDGTIDTRYAMREYPAWAHQVVSEARRNDPAGKPNPVRSR